MIDHINNLPLQQDCVELSGIEFPLDERDESALPVWQIMVFIQLH